MGWAAGFQAGSQLAQRGLDAYDKARKERLMSEAEKQTPTITEGAYGPDLDANIQELKRLRDRNVGAIGNTGYGYAEQGDEDAIAQYDAQRTAAGSAYDPAIQELERRRGLTQADYSLGSAGPNYATRERALSEQGIVTAMNQAQVYRQLGEPEKAADIENAALGRKLRLTQEDRAISAEERAKADELRQQAEEKRRGLAFTTDQETRKLNLKGAQRTESYASAADNWNKWSTQNPDATFEERIAQGRKLGVDPTVVNAEVTFKQAGDRHDASMRNLNQQFASGKISLEAAQRQAAEIQRNSAFDTTLQRAMASGEPVDIKAIAAQTKPTLDHQMKVAAGVLGMKENEFKAYQLEMQSAVQGAKDYRGLLALHKNDPRFSDGLHYKEDKGPNGEIILTEVDDKTGKATGRSRTYQDSAEAYADLSQEAVDPANLYTWRLGVEAKQATIDATRDKGLTKVKPADITARAKIYTTGTPAPINPATKRPYTPDEALAKARADLLGGTTDVADPVDSLIKRMQGGVNPPPSDAQTAAKQIRSVADIVAPRTPAPAIVPPTDPTTSQERLRGLYLGR